MRALNESLRIRRRLLQPRVLPNAVIPHRNCSARVGDRPLLRRNVEGTIEQHGRSKSTRSGCEENGGRSGRSRECADDRRRSAESCRDPGSEPSDRRPVRLDEPEGYVDRQWCESGGRERADIDDCAGRVTSRECWSRGKPATERSVYRTCEPEACEASREEAICPPRDRESRARKDPCRAKDPTSHSAGDTRDSRMAVDPPPCGRRWTEDPPPCREDGCADSSTFPRPARKPRKSRAQQFPAFTRSGVCRFERSGEQQSAASNVGDCVPSIASFKYRLSKCSWRQKTRNTAAREESPDDICRERQRKASPARCKEAKRLQPRRKRRGKGESPSEWSRQRYKVRLKSFQKGNGRLDPCLPQIVEVRSPRDGCRRSKPPSKPSCPAADEPTERSRSPCPSECPPTEPPVVETKSYWTKMEESRPVRRDGGPEKCKSREKYC